MEKPFVAAVEPLLKDTLEITLYQVPKVSTIEVFQLLVVTMALLTTSDLQDDYGAPVRLRDRGSGLPKLLPGGERGGTHARDEEEPGTAGQRGGRFPRHQLGRGKDPTSDETEIGRRAIVRRRQHQRQRERRRLHPDHSSERDFLRSRDTIDVVDAQKDAV